MEQVFCHLKKKKKKLPVVNLFGKTNQLEASVRKEQVEAAAGLSRELPQRDSLAEEAGLVAQYPGAPILTQARPCSPALGTF